MRTNISVMIFLLLSTTTCMAAELLRSNGGFYYPGNMKHKDSLYYGYGDKNPNFGNQCHLANDYNLAEGSPVYAVGSGIVQQVSNNIPFYGGDDGTPGGAIIIRHTTSNDTLFYALYGHIKNFKVRVGDTIKGGQQIAEVGSFTSGGRALPHLHFGINTQGASYQGYTPSAQCINYLGFVEPEQFMIINSAKLAATETCQANDDNVSTTINTPFTTPNLLANDNDFNGDILTVSSADSHSAKNAIITNNFNGTFTYSPVSNFTGTDSFNYTLTDNNGCIDQAKVTIRVNAENASNPGSPIDNGSGGGSFGFLGLIGLLLFRIKKQFGLRKDN